MAFNDLRKITPSFLQFKIIDVTLPRQQAVSAQIQPTSGPHLPHIRPTSGPHLPRICPTSAPHLSRIWPTSGPHPAHIRPTSVPHLAHIWPASVQMWAGSGPKLCCCLGSLIKSVWSETCDQCGIQSPTMHLAWALLGLLLNSLFDPPSRNVYT